MKHTPGPWDVKRESGLRQRIQTSGDKGTLAYMTTRPFAHGSNFSHEQISANARLIAAAPELLKAVRYAVDNPEFDSAKYDAMCRVLLNKVDGTGKTPALAKNA